MLSIQSGDVPIFSALAQAGLWGNNGRESGLIPPRNALNSRQNMIYIMGELRQLWFNMFAVILRGRRRTSTARVRRPIYALLYVEMAPSIFP